jgi:hypothetical protein
MLSYVRKPIAAAVIKTLIVLLSGAFVPSLWAQDEDLIDKVEIQKSSSEKQATQCAPEFLPRLSAKEEKIVDAMSRKTEVAFRDNDLATALNHLKELHEIEIWVDTNRLDVDSLRVTLEISDIPLKSCLNLMLEPLDLAYFIEDNTLKVTSQEIATAKWITRTYPAGDLFSSPKEAFELRELLITGLGLEHKEGISRSLAISTKSRAIVLRQSHQVHDEMLQLLRTLREANTMDSFVQASSAPNEIDLSIGYERDSKGRRLNDEPKVFHNGELYSVGDVALDEAHRQIELQLGKKGVRDARVRIRAERDVPLTALQELMEICKSAGFKNFALNSATN